MFVYSAVGNKRYDLKKVVGRSSTRIRREILDHGKKWEENYLQHYNNGTVPDGWATPTTNPSPASQVVS